GRAKRSIRISRETLQYEWRAILFAGVRVRSRAVCAPCISPLRLQFQLKLHSNPLPPSRSNWSRTKKLRSGLRSPDLRWNNHGRTYELTFGGKFLNIFATSLLIFLVFLSGFPDRSLLDVPLQ